VGTAADAPAARRDRVARVAGPDPGGDARRPTGARPLRRAHGAAGAPVVPNRPRQSAPPVARPTGRPWESTVSLPRPVPRLQPAHPPQLTGRDQPRPAGMTDRNRQPVRVGAPPGRPMDRATGRPAAPRPGRPAVLNADERAELDRLRVENAVLATELEGLRRVVADRRSFGLPPKTASDRR
jgi:hypothetical protein